MVRNSLLVTAIGLIIVVLLAAFGVAVWSRGREKAAPARDDSALRTELARLAQSQDHMVAVLEQLEQTLVGLSGGLALVPSERRAVPAAPPPENMDELIASIDALRVSIEVESRRTQELLRRGPTSGGESLLALREHNPTTNWAALDQLESDWRSKPEDAGDSQYFQTPHDLLRTYGPPSAIYRPEGGLLFVYRRHAEGEAGVAHYFRLQEGMVIESWVEDEKKEEKEKD